MKLINQIRQTAYKIYTSSETRTHNLFYLFFEITQKCNLNCIHCGSDCSSNSTMDELTTESWLKIIDYIKETFDPLPVVVITGGEPLVHPDLFIITKALNKNGFPWGMVTNGFTLNQQKVDTLMEHRIDSITLSFDGDSESVNFIRNTNKAYNRILNALDLIGKSNIPVKDTVTCVYPGNLNKLSWTADTLLEYGMNSHRLFRIFPMGRAAGNKALYLDFKQSNQIIKWIKENRTQYKKKGLNVSFSCEGYIPYGDDLKVRDEPFFCRSGINIASILCDGTITGCNNNGSDFYQGNILTENFAFVWQNKFQEYRNKNWLKTGICSDCADWDNCTGSSIHLRTKLGNDPQFCYVKKNNYF
ncbi:MAG: radical SAM protein [Spirochaetales bacterium]|nr:radical SAM protein [Spirochaetales bacterium]